jgi:hypothetical protein
MSETLKLTPICDGKYKLAEDWNGIPAGFITDGGSIPRFFWRFIGHPMESEYIDRYIEHDYDYQTGRVKRKTADKKLRDGLAADGMGWVKRNLVYSAVRVFGRSHYNNKKQGEIT